MNVSRPAVALVLCLFVTPLWASSPDVFDHGHAGWDALLQKHVRWINGGVASEVDYAGFARDRAALDAYTAGLEAVSAAQFDRWSGERQLAFLINAYNAFTVELILQAYPDIASIKDLGSLFRSPWKKKFFSLLGRERHLDELEHEMIRGRFQEPLIHVGVVCASIGCPALRDRAFTGDTLQADLEDSLERFLGDRSRNRYDAGRDTLQVSKIFDWYRKDFEQGWRGYDRLADVFAPYAALLADEPRAQAAIRAGTVGIEFLPYDWALNGSGGSS